MQVSACANIFCFISGGKSLQRIEKLPDLPLLSILYEDLLNRAYFGIMDYSSLKLIHILAVTIFIGNIITGLFWMRVAVKTKDLKIISFAVKGIRNGDRYLTIPCVLLVLIFGFLAARSGHFRISQNGWISWSVITFLISVIAFAIKVTPLQKKIYHFSLNKESLTDSEWKRFSNIYLTWEILGLTVLLTSLAAFIMMTLKIPQ